MAASSSRSASKKRSPNTALINKTAIERANTLLQDLPEKPKEQWSLKEAIEALDGSIAQALERGYSYDEVAALLNEQGITISVSSLKRYLAASLKEKGLQPHRVRKTRNHSAKLPTLDALPDPAAEAATQPTPPATAPATGRRKGTASDASDPKPKVRSATRSKTASTARSPRKATKTAPTE